MSKGGKHAEFWHLLNRLPKLTKEEIVYQYSGGTSLSELYERSPKQYREMIVAMRQLVEPDKKEPSVEQWQKRVVAAIAGYYNKTGKYTDKSRTDRLHIILATACRSSGTDEFGKMSIPQLRRVYSEFVQKQRTYENVEKISKETEKRVIKRGTLTVII